MPAGRKVSSTRILKASWAAAPGLINGRLESKTRKSRGQRS
jgi:hypothetical protein